MQNLPRQFYVWPPLPLPKPTPLRKIGHVKARNNPPANFTDLLSILGEGMPGPRLTPDQFRQTTGIPEDWEFSDADNGKGWKWVNPKRPSQQVRAMFGDAKASNPVKHSPYVRYTNGNGFVDKDGNLVPKVPGQPPSNDTYIPWFLFKYRP